jgi:hypothetical protein
MIDALGAKVSPLPPSAACTSEFPGIPRFGVKPMLA